ncbi:MAG: Crp/Fnr family transcriptional regulator [Ruminococcaceae bacterium]|nr:Crp/Fnr family transcriptional regulator [Oscillospiraceae bacterium]
MYEEIIAKNSLFAGLSEDDTQYALSFFGAKPAHFEKGEMLARAGEPLTRFGMVLSGNVQVCMEDFDGNSIIMAIVTPGHTFGESLCFIGNESPVNIYAVSDTELLWLKTDKIKEHGSDKIAVLITDRFISMLAARTLEMNDRIQILSKIKLRDRLVTYFSQNVSKYGMSFRLPLSREDMAAYLGTDRSALSRELGKMRDEGIIEFCRNNFTIKHRI